MDYEATVIDASGEITQVKYSPEQIVQRQDEEAAWAKYISQDNRPVNDKLESAFLSLLPKHLGKPYLTNELMVGIGSLKQVVTDYNRLGLYTISKGMLAGVALPSEMEPDRQQLLKLYP